MSPNQISRLAKVMVNDPQIMSILRGGEKNVDGKVQKGLSKCFRSHSKREKEVVERGVKR